ncbi:MAG: DUF5009 domain-containing protein [Flavisolibacter sp.]
MNKIGEDHSQAVLKGPSRLLSLDFVRGLTMVLLTLESTELYSNLRPAVTGSFGSGIVAQFFHHPWHGLHLWDLIQPIFMFVAGTAMALSLQKQRLNTNWPGRLRKILKRCFWLFFWGVLDYAVRKQGLSFELWDVLTQLSFTTLVAFLIIEFPIVIQIAVSLLLLLIAEILYRYMHIPGFDQAFVNHHNFGNYMDLRLMHKINRDGWVAINCISTSAHTIWGTIAGKILIGSRDPRGKLLLMLAGAVCLLIFGYALDLTGITPIIKKIATSSFVLVSGGYCLVFLTFSYWWIDALQHKKHLVLFSVFGMNSIFIYLFFEIVAARWFNGYIFSITGGLFDMASLPILGSLVIFFLEFGMLYFLYRKKIFFRL